MEIETKIIKKGHDEVVVKCPKCNRGNDVFFDGKIAIDCKSTFDILENNQLECRFCHTIFEVTVRK